MARIGLVGFSTHSGLGNQNRDIARFLPADAWLTWPHPTYPHVPIPVGVTEYTVPDAFLAAVDVVLFVESPRADDPLLLAKARDQGKRVVCVPNHEWFPLAQKAKGWPQYVDRFVCPTGQAFGLFTGWGLPCVHFPWPVDTEVFPFRQRESCERFVFLNGRGGTRGRKGLSVIRELVKLWPEIPLTVFSQATIQPLADHTPHLTLRSHVDNPADLYAAGDVLLCPHHVDGLGMEPLEAMASGMPVIATDGPPWNELPLPWAIPATVRKERMPRREVDWYEPSALALKNLCRTWRGERIQGVSRWVRIYAEQRSWQTQAATLRQLVEGD